VVVGSAPTAPAMPRWKVHQAVAGSGMGDRGYQGTGRHIAMRLLRDGEHVVDVPPKLSARARVFPRGRAVRPMPPMRIRLRWPAPGWPGCAR
jgi:hypothetical protein